MYISPLKYDVRCENALLTAKLRGSIAMTWGVDAVLVSKLNLTFRYSGPDSNPYYFSFIAFYLVLLFAGCFLPQPRQSKFSVTAHYTKIKYRTREATTLTFWIRKRRYIDFKRVYLNNKILDTSRFFRLSF